MKEEQSARNKYCYICGVALTSEAMKNPTQITIDRKLRNVHANCANKIRKAANDMEK